MCRSGSLRRASIYDALVNDEAPTERLREEHHLILAVAGVLDDIVTVAEGGDGFDFVTADRCVAFFRLFVDAFHHGKEEELLFPELGSHGLSYDGGPIAVMLAEHGEGRAFVRKMSEAIGDARNGDAAALAVLLAAGRGYVDLIRSHILKENTVLFTMADQMIVGTDRIRLCGAYESAGEGVFEGQTRADLADLARRLMEKYPQR